MRSTHSFAINIIKRNCRNDKAKALLYVRITVDNQRAEISLKEEINIAAWDSAREIVTSKGIEAKQLNQHLEAVRFQIKTKYREMREEEKLITAETLKENYLGKQKELKGHTMHELLNYFQKIWKEKMDPGGFKNYKTTIRYLEVFVQKNYAGREVFLKEVDGEFATNFEHYVRTTPIKKHDPCLGNGVGKHVQRFKRILNWATDDLKWLKFNPCSSYSCPLKKSKRKKLTFQELVSLESKKFSDPTLEYVQDLFLYSCYTGLAYIDSMALEYSHFEWEENNVVWCKIYRTKSDEFCAVPLLESAASILNKYKVEKHDAINSKIFPRISNKHVNDCLKIIQQACEILTPITFHVARHTFAKTVALKNGVPLETVQMMMGHTKISTTQIYAQVDEEKIMRDMDGVEARLKRKREIFQLDKNPRSFYENFQP